MSAPILLEPLPARRTESGRYRVEASGVQHSQVARVALPELLADPSAEIDWYRPPGA